MTTRLDADQWVALIERIEQAMCVIPFMPRQEDVVTLLSMAANSYQQTLLIEDLRAQLQQDREREASEQ